MGAGASPDLVMCAVPSETGSDDMNDVGDDVSTSERSMFEDVPGVLLKAPKRALPQRASTVSFSSRRDDKDGRGGSVLLCADRPVPLAAPV